jgi:hypothetical protein
MPLWSTRETAGYPICTLQYLLSNTSAAFLLQQTSASVSPLGSTVREMGERVRGQRALNEITSEEGSSTSFEDKYL